MLLLYKKHFVGKYIYMDNIDKQKHLPEQEAQRTHTVTCLI